MQIIRVFGDAGWKRSKKREALERILAKLERKRSQIEHDLAFEESQKKRKRLDIDLRTNSRHIVKAKRLLTEFGKRVTDGHGREFRTWRWQPTSDNGLFGSRFGRLQPRRRGLA